MKKMNKKGFTLAELLIVVAIIAVLVAIAIPVFSGQLEKAKESTDAANLRAAYATASVQVLETETGVAAGPVAMTQGTAGFASAVKDNTVGGIKLETLSTAKSGVSFYVNVGTDGTVKIQTTVEDGYTKVDPITGKAST